MSCCEREGKIDEGRPKTMRLLFGGSEASGVTLNNGSQNILTYLNKLTSTV